MRIKKTGARLRLLVTLFLSSTTGAAFASDYSVTAAMSTLGPGIQVSKPINDMLNFRFFISGYRYTTEDNLDDIRYKAKYTLSGAGALVDWHPFHSGFHVSFGLVRTSSRFDGSSVAAEQYAIGNHTYSVGDVAQVRAKIDLGAGAPYSGMGWGYQIGSTGIGFAVEAGVIFQPRPAATVYVTPGSAFTASLDADQQARLGLLQQDAKQEAHNLEQDFSTFKAFPLVSAGITYRF